MTNILCAQSFLRVFVLLAIAGLTFGCGTDYGRLEPQPVSGQVVINGEPAVGCTVVFIPRETELKGQVMPGGKTTAGGLFRLTSHETDDGAPVGDYGVTLHWPATTWPTMEEEMRRDRDPVKPVGPDRLQGRFSSPAKSGLSVTIEPGDNTIDAFYLDDVELMLGTETESIQ